MIMENAWNTFLMIPAINHPMRGIFLVTKFVAVGRITRNNTPLNISLSLRCCWLARFDAIFPVCMSLRTVCVWETDKATNSLMSWTNASTNLIRPHTRPLYTVVMRAKKANMMS